MKHDTLPILKLLITFLKELVMDQGSFSAKCTRLSTMDGFYETYTKDI